MEDLFAMVQTAFASAFGIDPQTVKMATTPGEIPEWDSMGHVTLASSLEKAFGVSFDVDDLMQMEDVEKIVRVVRAKLGVPKREPV